MGVDGKHDEGINRSDYHGTFPCCVKSLTNFLASFPNSARSCFFPSFCHICFASDFAVSFKWLAIYPWFLFLFNLLISLSLEINFKHFLSSRGLPARLDGRILFNFLRAAFRWIFNSTGDLFCVERFYGEWKHRLRCCWGAKPCGIAG